MCLCVCRGKSETGKALVFFQALEGFGVSSCMADKSVFRCILAAKTKLILFGVIQIKEKFLLEKL